MNRPGPWPSREECLAALHDGKGEGVRVAVLDTGVDDGHEDFGEATFGGFWNAGVQDGEVAVEKCAPGDPVGHGTGIAGVILRLAPRAEILSIRVLDASSRQRRHEAIHAGALLALAEGAAVLNCSFGVPGTAFTLLSHLAWTDAAFHRSRIVVAAASNESAAALEWPSHLASVLGVTAADRNAEEIEWRPGHPIPLAAAGVSVLVPVPGGGHKRVTGSSFAAAHVTGLLARLISQFPGISPSLAKETLRHAASPGISDPP